MEDLDCAKTTAVKILAELDNKKGIGLSEKKRQELGKPDIIYVKNFVEAEVQNVNFKKYKEMYSGGTEDELAMVQELNGNYNNKSYTEKSNSYLPYFKMVK